MAKTKRRKKFKDRKECMMQFYHDDEMGSSIAIIFEGNEIPLGIQLMSELLHTMKINGADGIKDTEQWLLKLKTKRMNEQISRYVQ